jgi:hypothetical protein
MSANRLGFAFFESRESGGFNLNEAAAVFVALAVRDPAEAVFGFFNAFQGAFYLNGRWRFFKTDPTHERLPGSASRLNCSAPAFLNLAKVFAGRHSPSVLSAITGVGENV